MADCSTTKMSSVTWQPQQQTECWPWSK